MQPNHDDDTWQKPSEQPTQAPYAVPSDTAEKPSAPVVTMTPDVKNQPLAPAPVQDDQETEDLSEEEELEDDAPVRWQAQEYIHREKNYLWFVVFGVVVVGLVAAAIFLMDSLTFAILVPVMAAALIVYTHRPPRILDYTLGRQGLHVNDQLYRFSEFKGFGVIHDDGEYSVMLIPIKRFRPGVVVYFPEDAGEAIVDMLGARLPMQELHPDLVDRIIRKLRI
jgi:hypothetical protein